MVATLIVPSVDPEFRALCHPLTEEEKSNLERLIVESNRCDDLVAWNTDGNPLLDGHHRLEICEKHGIRYNVRLIDLPSREAAIGFIARIQLGRRNVPEEQKSYLRGKMYNQTKVERGGDRHNTPQSERSKGQSVPLIGNKGNTQERTSARLAEEFDVNEKAIRRDGQFAEAVDALAEKSPDLARAAREGDIPKSSVPKLANATKGVLAILEKKADDPKSLRAATKKLTGATRNNGKPKANWKALEDQLGKALRMIDDLHHAAPHGNLHRSMIADVKQAMGHLAEWKRMQRAA